MGHLPVLQEGGAKALRSELFGTFPGDRFIQEGGARALRRECFGSLARCPSLRGRRFGAFQLYVLVGFKGDVRPLGGPGGAPARPSGRWG